MIINAYVTKPKLQRRLAVGAAWWFTLICMQHGC